MMIAVAEMLTYKLGFVKIHCANVAYDVSLFVFWMICPIITLIQS